MGMSLQLYKLSSSLKKTISSHKEDDPHLAAHLHFLANNVKSIMGEHEEGSLQQAFQDMIPFSIILSVNPNETTPLLHIKANW